MLRLLVCVSGGGTNLQAIFDAIDAGKIRNAEIAAVISNNPGAYALERARQHNVEAICLSPKSFESRETFNHALTEKVKEIGRQAGYRDNRHFCKMFKRVTGMTPQEYRKLNV